MSLENKNTGVSLGTTLAVADSKLKGFRFLFTDKNNNQIGYVYVEPPLGEKPGLLTLIIADTTKRQQAFEEAKHLASILGKNVSQDGDKIEFREIDPEFAPIVVEGLEQRGLIAQGSAKQFHDSFLAALGNMDYIPERSALQEGEEAKQLLQKYQLHPAKGPEPPKIAIEKLPAKTEKKNSAPASKDSTAKPSRTPNKSSPSQEKSLRDLGQHELKRLRALARAAVTGIAGMIHHTTPKAGKPNPIRENAKITTLAAKPVKWPWRGRNI